VINRKFRKKMKTPSIPNSHPLDCKKKSLKNSTKGGNQKAQTGQHNKKNTVEKKSPNRVSNWKPS